MHKKLIQLLTALSIRLQGRRAAGLKKLIADNWEEQISKIVGLEEKPEELEDALAELSRTLYAEVDDRENTKESPRNARELAELLSEMKVCAGGCGFFQFERTCEAASFRVWDYVRTLDQ